MAFSRAQLLEIITPHVLRTLVRLHGSCGGRVTEEDLMQAGLNPEQKQALVQTKRLLEVEPGTYNVNL